MKRTLGTNHVVKILLVGDSGVGKTSLLHRFKRGVFRSNLVSTIGVDFGSRHVEVKGKKVKLQIWDTSGCYRFPAVRSGYPISHGFMVVYDITSRDTFDGVRYRAKEIEEHVGKGGNVLLIGNKADDTANRVVSTEEGKALANDLGMHFLESSAQNHSNVEEGFLHLAKEHINSLREAKTAVGARALLINDDGTTQASTYPSALQRVGEDCGLGEVFGLLKEKPDIIDAFFTERGANISE